MKKVLKFIEQDDCSYRVVDSSIIETSDWSDVYNQYGQKMFDEVQGITSDMITYTDGSNFKTDVIDDSVYPSPKFAYADDEISEKILAELSCAEFSDYEQGVATAQTENFTFTKSLFANYGIDVI